MQKSGVIKEDSLWGGGAQLEVVRIGKTDCKAKKEHSKRIEIKVLYERPAALPLNRHGTIVGLVFCKVVRGH